MKIRRIIISIIVILITCSTVCFASTIDTNFYKPDALEPGDYEEAFNVVDGLVYGIRVIGIIVSIVGLMVIGIKYMTGSIEEKAEYKQTMIPYVIGCIILFAISTIVNVLYEIGSNFNS